MHTLNFENIHNYGFLCSACYCMPHQYNTYLVVWLQLGPGQLEVPREQPPPPAELGLHHLKYNQ